MDERLVLDEVRVDALDGDPLLEAAGAVHAREVHARHAADADLVDDAVAPEEVRARAPVRDRPLRRGARRVRTSPHVGRGNVGFGGRDLEALPLLLSFSVSAGNHASTTERHVVTWAELVEGECAAGGEDRAADDVEPG